MRSCVAACFLLMLSITATPSGQESVTVRPQDTFLTGVPLEFRYLFDGGIPNGQLQSTWAALPYDSIRLQYGGYDVMFYRRKPIDPSANEYEERLGRAELTADKTSAGMVGPSSPYSTRPVVGQTGQFSGWIDIWAFGRLCYLIQQSRFHALGDGYSAGRNHAELVVVTVAGPNGTKEIRDYGPVGPIELWGVQQAIEVEMRRVQWMAKK